MKFGSTAAAVFALALLPAAVQAVELLKKEPPKGALVQGQVVYVDDHACPKGQIKKVVGAASIGSPRTKSCVPKPK